MGAALLLHYPRGLLPLAAIAVWLALLVTVTLLALAAPGAGEAMTVASDPNDTSPFRWS